MFHKLIKVSARLFPTRIIALTRVLSIALLSGIALSFNLWFPINRTFPRAGVIDLPPAVEIALSGLLAFSLLMLIISERRGLYLLAALSLLVLLILLDQMRLQPWVYQYSILFAVIALTRQTEEAAMSLLQLVVAGLYFWSGVQKLNFIFHQEVLPQLLAPFANYWIPGTNQLLILGLVIASIEIALSLGLIWKRTRNISVWVGVAMHVLLITLLVTMAHNRVVWPWNATLAVLLLLTFLGTRNSIGRAFARTGSESRHAQLLVVLVLSLPVLSLSGHWDLYLSGALYSGITPQAVIRLPPTGVEMLPEAAKQQVFTTTSGDAALPLTEWSMAELNVPPYPEERVYRRVAAFVCRSSPEPRGIELVIRESPERLSGRYQVKRLNCDELIR